MTDSLQDQFNLPAALPGREPGFIEVARRITCDHQWQTVDGLILDLFTASRIVAAYDAIRDPNKGAMTTKIGLLRFAAFAIKVTK
jgi:hypothetical protein